MVVLNATEDICSAMNHFSQLCCCVTVCSLLCAVMWTRLRAVYCAALLADVTGISEYCVLHL